MSDPDEWQKSEAQRRSGPEPEGQAPRRSMQQGEQADGRLTQREVERIEEDVREEVEAAGPAISDS